MAYNETLEEARKNSLGEEFTIPTRPHALRMLKCKWEIYDASTQRDFRKFVEQYSDLEQLAHNAAFEHLQLSFNPFRSNGFEKWHRALQYIRSQIPVTTPEERWERWKYSDETETFDLSLVKIPK